MTATKVLDEVSGGNFGTEDEDSLVSDKALKVSERISKLFTLFILFRYENWIEAGISESEYTDGGCITDES